MMAMILKKLMFQKDTRKFMMKQLNDLVMPEGIPLTFRRKEKSRFSILTSKRTLASIPISILKSYLEVSSAIAKTRLLNQMALKSVLIPTKSR